MIALADKSHASIGQASGWIASLLDLAEDEGIQVNLLVDRVEFGCDRANSKLLPVLEAQQGAIYRHLVGAPEVPLAQVASDDFISACDVLEHHTKERQAVIEGLLRRGETANLIGAAKAGKSFLLAGMILSVASGTPWLGREVIKGRCLLIDNELHRSTLLNRLTKIAAGMGINFQSLPLEIWSLRGQLRDIDGIRDRLRAVERGKYSLVAIDAFYRALPKGVSENDNAQMASVYNTLDAIAGELDAALVLNHHSSKGNQSDKSITDVGSGAGSIARAPDTHLIIRPHEQENLAVMEAVCRSWAAPLPQTIAWAFPLWWPSEIAPEIARPKPKNEINQEKRDRETEAEILKVLPSRGLTISQLRGETGFGDARVRRTVKSLKAAGKVRVRRAIRKSTGKVEERIVKIEK